MSQVGVGARTGHTQGEGVPVPQSPPPLSPHGLAPKIHQALEPIPVLDLGNDCCAWFCKEHGEMRARLGVGVLESKGGMQGARLFIGLVQYGHLHIGVYKADITICTVTFR